jgi:hypothetical protein
MSVLRCGRYDCEEIMCTRMILDGDYYICEDCWQELLKYKNDWPEEMTALEVKQAIVDFMHSPVGTYHKMQSVDIDAEFKRLTGQEDD